MPIQEVVVGLRVVRPIQDKIALRGKTRNSAEWLRLRSEPLGLVRPPSVRIRIEHWELNIGQIPIGHSAKLFLRKPLVRSLIVQRDETRLGAVLHDVDEL